MKRQTRTAVDAILGDIETTGEQTHKRRSDYKGPRNWKEIARKHGQPTTYRIPSDLRDAIKSRAEAEGLSLSEFVTRLLEHAIDDWDSGHLKLPREDA